MKKIKNYNDAFCKEVIAGNLETIASAFQTFILYRLIETAGLLKNEWGDKLKYFTYTTKPIDLTEDYADIREQLAHGLILDISEFINKHGIKTGTIDKINISKLEDDSLILRVIFYYNLK